MRGTLTIEGLDALVRKMQQLPAEARAKGMRAMQAGGMEIIAKAQDNLRSNNSIVTGLLRLSGKVQKVSETDLDAGFFDTRNEGSGYAEYVEYGRRAGRMPPPDVLTQWAKKKYRLDDAEARKMGWSMAVRIAREGTRPHAFLGPAIKSEADKVLRRMREALGINS